MTSSNGARGFLESDFFVNVEASIVHFGVVAANTAEILGFVQAFISHSSAVSFHFPPHLVDVESFDFFVCDVNYSVR
jgi:hypothetical protein